ncbi:MAG: hypothetical protein VXY56_08310, partial [Pseudomonadota bacterium]|nr:hypothetical protein [Pseudomonadota bacterium]
DPEIAAKIAALGMRDGWFTGLGLKRWINGDKISFYYARQIINGLDKAADIENLANKWSESLAGIVMSLEGFSVLVVRLLDLSERAVVGKKIDIVVSDSEFNQSYKTLVNGYIPPIYLPRGTSFQFKVDDKDCLTSVTIGEPTKLITLIDGSCNFQSNTMLHQGEPANVIPSSNQPTNNQASNQASTENITFNLKIVEGDTTKVIPNIAYKLKYKGNLKGRTANAQGLENNVKAETGQTIDVYVAGDPDDQKIASFTVSSALQGKTHTIKVPVVSISVNVLSQSGKPIQRYLADSHYRGANNEKITNNQGQFTLKALAGHPVELQTKHSERLAQFIIDQRKTVWTLKVKLQSVSISTLTAQGQARSMSLTIDDGISKRDVQSNTQGQFIYHAFRGTTLRLKTVHGTISASVTAQLDRVSIGKSTGDRNSDASTASRSTESASEVTAPSTAKTPKTESQPAPEPNSPPAAKNATPRISNNDIRNQNGHPVVQVQSDTVSFELQFLDKSNNQALSGYSYILNSSYGRNTWQTGSTGKRATPHQAAVGTKIQVIVSNNGKDEQLEEFTVARGMKIKVFKVEKPVLKGVRIVAEGQMSTALLGKGTMKIFSDNSILVIINASYGGFGSGAPPNGNYKIHTYSNRRPGHRYNKGMNLNNVGFSFNMDPTFKTQRSLLRIHPDGNNIGTLGCIGLIGSQAELENIESIIKKSLQEVSYIPLILNIEKNPNNHIPPKSRSLPNE